MSGRLMVVCLCLIAGPAAAQDPFATNIRPTAPLTPEAERATFKLPPGFEIQLVASEPDILKPLNLAFDARGRMWVTDSTEYPYPVPADSHGRDTIKILEDTDGDGRADRITTFADGLNIPIGIYPLEDAAIVFSIPNVWLFEDTDRDGQCDKRTRLFGPFGYERDTHGLNNAFRRGFDGWLYACHGYNNETAVSGADGHMIKMQSGNTYRMRLDGSRIEQFTWGQVNPFGMTIDPLGNLFTADCHSLPVTQLLRGGYYPSFGKPHDGLGFVPPMMAHLHGSTAIAGIAYSTGEQFPLEFRDNIFTGNVMTSRVNRDTLAFHGSTISAIEQPDFVVTTDPWFRPVDLRMGPDGALYIADFYNRVIGHYEVPLDHPGRDRHRGRIWRVVYRGDQAASEPVAPQPQPLDTLSLAQVVAATADPNLERRLLATNWLVDHFGAAAVETLEHALPSSSPEQRVSLLWALERLGAPPSASDLRQGMSDPDRLVRVHILRILSERLAWTADERALALEGLADRDAFVQRAAADALGRHPAVSQLSPLLRAVESAPADDRLLQHTLRMALRDQFRADGAGAHLAALAADTAVQQVLADAALGLADPVAGDFLVAYLETAAEPPARLIEMIRHAARNVTTERSDQLAELIQHRYSANIDLQQDLLEAVYRGLAQQGASPGQDVDRWARKLANELLESIDAASLAWGNSPLAQMRLADNPWVREQRVSADGDRQSWFLGSLPGGERLTGRLRSRTFEIPPRLSFYLAGHNGLPGQPAAHSNVVRLRHATTHAVLAEATAPRNDVAQKVDWPLDAFRAEPGYLEIVDGDQRNSYAWLAVGRLEPAVVPFPTLAPALVARRLIGAATIAGARRDASFRERLKELLLSPAVEPAVRRQAAQALLAMAPDGRRAALVPIIGDPATADALRDRACQAMVDQDETELLETMGDLLAQSPRRLQLSLATGLASNRSGAELLFELVTQARAPARLLLDPTLAARLSAVGIPNAESIVSRLTRGLAPESETIQPEIQKRIAQYAFRRRSAEHGKVVFEKNCAKCHQIAGQGQVIGPQLDGIGNRGLERVVEDLLDPNRNVDVAFRTTSLRLDDGRVLTGLFRREEGALLILADQEGKEFSVATESIEQRRTTHVSLMPENLVEPIPDNDLHDLFAYLLAQTHPGAKPPTQLPESAK